VQTPAPVDVDRVVARVRELATDELAVVDHVVRRLLDVGRRDYGELRLDTDKRDLQAEADDEIADWMIYNAMLRIRRARGG
jgi:hypothetical protein